MKSIDSSSVKKIVSTHNGTCVEEDSATRQRSLHATKAFKRGDVVSIFTPEEELSSPTYLTVQKADGLHITLSPSFLQYVNHACSPTAFFDTTFMQFVALKDVDEGEELTFFYPSTEWQMAQAFTCHCGNIDCLGTIQGAAFLPEKVLQRYRLTDFIKRKLEERRQERA